MEYPDPTLYAVPLFALGLWLEPRILRGMRERGAPVLGYERRDAIASVALGTLSVISVSAINFGVFVLATQLYAHRFFTLGEGALGWTAALVGWDFLYYWHHRVEHENRVLWACHVNHHSSRYYNFSTALRQPWTPWISLVFYPWMSLLGVTPWMILASGGLNLVYQYWIHTEVVDRMPRWYEWIFNTPSHHRVHHGSNPEYLDKNYGGVLIVWDRLFGSFAPERGRVIYGLTKNIETFNLLEIAFHEYAAIARDVRGARTLREKLLILWHGPEWRAPSLQVPAE